MRNPADIHEIEAGYEYSLPYYEVTDEGIDCPSASHIRFCRGDKSDPTKPRQAGFFVESLLEACIRRLCVVNVGDLANEDTTKAVFRLEQSLELLGRRSKKREEANVLGTYKP